MSAPLRTRLVLSFLIVLFIGMGMAAGLAWITVERLYLDTEQENLLAQARLTAEALRGEDLSALGTEPYSQTTNVLPGIHTHLLAEQDAVVLSLPIGPNSPSQRVPSAENSRAVSAEALLQRTEIASALQGKPATAIRKVASANGKRVLYAAAPAYSAQGEMSGIVYLATPLPARGLPSSVIAQLAVAVIFASLLALGIATIISRRIAFPIEAIATAANQVAGGDLNLQVPMTSSIRELESLGRSFNAMTASLRQSEQVRNTFIADVTHELRTPLTVIKGTIETLEDGALDDAEGRGPLLISMQRETERLIRLVNDLLVLTRADAGALKLNLQCLDLAELAHSRCKTLTPLAKIHGLDLQVKSCEQANVLGDADRLAQVLDNLLDNAIRYAPEGSTVSINVRREVEAIRVEVNNHGKGIPAEHLPYIFERFYRADSSRNRQTGGTGLGLAIVRALVLAQGGRVKADSVEGEETTVTFWLPVGGNCLPTD